MRHEIEDREISGGRFEAIQQEYAKWAPLFRRLGLKPRRFVKGQDAVFFGTNEGWFRLSLTNFPKDELKWLRTILEYLEERSFTNWAVPWQKTIIWEDNGVCYLIQPWLFESERFRFNPEDPASLGRVAEVLADLHRAGRDYREIKGIGIARDRWRTLESDWEKNLQTMEGFEENAYHEKVRKGLFDLKKEAAGAIREALSNWRNSGIHSLFEHQFRSGMVCHGSLVSDHIIWRNNDFYLLNWENLSFRPRIFDLASFITSVGVWESDWILYFIREYCRLQPFWAEEHAALMVLLRYPSEILSLLESALRDDFDKKRFKEVGKELAKKERCLTKVWRELGSPQRWAWGKPTGDEPGKMALTLTPVETWGDFSGSVDSLIQVNNEHKLPSDLFERLTCPERGDCVFGGRDGNVLEAALGQQNEYELEESPPSITEEEVEAISETESESAEYLSHPEIKTNSNVLTESEKPSSSPPGFKAETAPGLEWQIKKSIPYSNEMFFSPKEGNDGRSALMPEPSQTQPVRWSKFPVSIGKKG